MSNLSILSNVLVAGVTVGILSESVKQIKNTQKDDKGKGSKRIRREEQGHLFQW